MYSTDKSTWHLCAHITSTNIIESVNWFLNWSKFLMLYSEINKQGQYHQKCEWEFKVKTRSSGCVVEAKIVPIIAHITPVFQYRGSFRTCDVEAWPCRPYTSEKIIKPETKSSYSNTRAITSNRAQSDGTHNRSWAPEQHSSEKTCSCGELLATRFELVPFDRPGNRTQDLSHQ